MAQAGDCSTRRARTAQRQRREAAPCSRVTGTASTGRHRTHAVPGPAFPHRCAGGGRAFASRHRRGRRNRSRFRHPFGEPRPVGSTPHVRADGARSATTHAGPRPPTAESDSTHTPRGTATTGLAPSPNDGGYRSRVSVPFGRCGGTGSRWRCTVHGLAHPCQCTCHTGQRGVTGGAARARRFDQPQVAPPDPITCCVGANASVIPVTGDIPGRAVLRERPVYVHARRRTSTRCRGRRTTSLTRAIPTPVRTLGPGDASPRPDGAGSRCTLRAHRWVQATANGNPGPPPSYRVGVTLGVPYRTATGTPTGQRSNAPRYGNRVPQRRAFVREASAGPNAEGDTERRTPREGGCPWCERKGRAQGQQRAQVEQGRARGGKARGYCDSGEAVMRRAEHLGCWDFHVTRPSSEKLKSVLGGGFAKILQRHTLRTCRWVTSNP